MTAGGLQFPREVGLGLAADLEIGRYIHAPLYADCVPGSIAEYALPGTTYAHGLGIIWRMAKKQQKPEHHLRAWRKFRGMTLEDLAKAVGTTKGVISELELSKKGLSLKWLYRLAPALKTSPGMIVDYHPEAVDQEAMEAFLGVGEADKAQVLKVIEVFQKKAS